MPSLAQAWESGAGEHEREGVFDHAVANHGGQEGGERGAEEPAEGHGQIVEGEVAGVGSCCGDLTMAHPAGDEEDDEVKGDPVGVHDTREEDGQEREDGPGEEPSGDGGELGAPGAEDHHPGDEVEAQRQDPEERHGREVGGEVDGQPGEEAACDGGEAEPAEDGRAAWGR